MVAIWEANLAPLDRLDRRIATGEVATLARLSKRWCEVSGGDATFLFSFHFLLAAWEWSLLSISFGIFTLRLYALFNETIIIGVRPIMVPPASDFNASTNIVFELGLRLSPCGQLDELLCLIWCLCYDWLWSSLILWCGVLEGQLVLQLHILGWLSQLCNLFTLILHLLL